MWEAECQVEEEDDWERKEEDGHKEDEGKFSLEQCHIFHKKVVEITEVKWSKKREF
jgi:hypothetical protein